MAMGQGKGLPQSLQTSVDGSATRTEALRQCLVWSPSQRFSSVLRSFIKQTQAPSHRHLRSAARSVQHLLTRYFQSNLRACWNVLYLFLSLNLMPTRVMKSCPSSSHANSTSPGRTQPGTSFHLAVSTFAYNAILCNISATRRYNGPVQRSRWGRFPRLARGTGASW